MALPTLTWNMTGDDGLPHILTEADAEWTGLSIDASDDISVNFLKFIGRVVEFDCVHYEVVAQSYNDTDGTLVIKHKTAAPSNSPLTGIYYVLGTTTANMNDGNSFANSLMGATNTAGTTWGLPPHNFSDNNNTKGHIWMQMIIGIDEAFVTTIDDDNFGPYSWRGKTVNGGPYDWWDNANYTSGTARASGYGTCCGDINSHNAATHGSYRFGVTFIESTESFAMSIRNIANDICWITCAGAMLDPADKENYAEVGDTPLLTGWEDSSYVDSDDNRIFGICHSATVSSDDTTGVNDEFWSILGEQNNNSSNHSLFVPRASGGAVGHPTSAYFRPTTLNSEVLRMSRFDAHKMEEIGLNKLTTYSGKKVHLDVWMHRHSHSWYLVGKLRQMRVGDDGFSRSIFKSGGNQVSCSLGARMNSIADCIMFDND
jgi:hypothetical protein